MLVPLTCNSSPDKACCPLHAPTCNSSPDKACCPLHAYHMQQLTRQSLLETRLYSAPACALICTLMCGHRTLLRRCMSHFVCHSPCAITEISPLSTPVSTQPIHLPMEISPYITPSANTAHYVVAHMLHLPGSVPFHKNMPPNMPHVSLAPPHQVTVHAGATPPSHGPCHFPYSQIGMSHTSPTRNCRRPRRWALQAAPALDPAPSSFQACVSPRNNLCDFTPFSEEGPPTRGNPLQIFLSL
ncbi:hypothetical protein ACOSP7_013490 [Xanthoceras sorbifolium]